MILGIGADIVQIKRVAALLERQGQRFVERILTPTEQDLLAAQNYPERYLAKRFAAKEAAAKALGTGIGRGISFQHFEVSNDPFGAPILSFTGQAQTLQVERGISAIHLTITDEEAYAAAFVILESG